MACQQQHPLTPVPSRPIFGLTACLLSPNSSRAGRTTKHEPNRPTDRRFRCRTHGTHTPARRRGGGGAAAQLKRQRLAKTEAKFWGVDWTNERRTEMTTFETLRPSARRAPPRAASSGRRAAFSVASASLGSPRRRRLTLNSARLMRRRPRTTFTVPCHHRRTSRDRIWSCSSCAVDCLPAVHPTCPSCHPSCHLLHLGWHYQWIHS